MQPYPHKAGNFDQEASIAFLSHAFTCIVNDRVYLTSCNVFIWTQYNFVKQYSYVTFSCTVISFKAVCKQMYFQNLNLERPLALHSRHYMSDIFVW